jgi:hypothetical protein
MRSTTFLRVKTLYKPIRYGDNCWFGTNRSSFSLSALRFSPASFRLRAFSYQQAISLYFQLEIPPSSGLPLPPLPPFPSSSLPSPTLSPLSTASPQRVASLQLSYHFSGVQWSVSLALKQGKMSALHLYKRGSASVEGGFEI